jgi:hypothetical protein
MANNGKFPFQTKPPMTNYAADRLMIKTNKEDVNLKQENQQLRQAMDFYYPNGIENIIKSFMYQYLKDNKKDEITVKSYYELIAKLGDELKKDKELYLKMNTILKGLKYNEFKIELDKFKLFEEVKDDKNCQK